MSFEHPNRNHRTIQEVEREIMRRPPEHNMTNLNLDRMVLMLDLLGHPEHSFRVIHVTGTNGKGSIAKMAEAICHAYGLRTGLYTSPHLERINERISIDGQQLSDDDFVDVYDQGKLALTVSRIFPLAQIREAHHWLDTGHSRGKIAIQVALSSYG